MIRVMIVEDEPPIAKSIQLLVEQYGGVQVVHTAINGKRALDYLEKEPVDLVFSDIKMPIMDGLELAKHLNQDYPDVTMVIVSGFQEFEFARTAIRYGVSNYLLKPISQAAINEVLEKSCGEIRKRRDRAARQLLERAINSEETAGSSRQGELCGVILACAGAYPLTPDELMLANRDLWGGVDLEEELKGLLEPGETCIGISGRSLSEKALVFSASHPDRIRLVAEALFRQLKDGGSHITLVVQENPVPLNGVGEIFQRLRKKLYKEIRLFLPELIWTDQPRKRDKIDPGERMKEVIRALQTQDPVTIREAVEDLVEVHVLEQARQNELVICLEKLAMNSFDNILDLQEMGDLKLELHSAVSTAGTPEELADELAQVLLSWLRPKNQPDKGKLQDLCEEVAAYIRLNYRGNITTAALSRQFGFSSTQLAKKFKEYFGVSISEFVNNYRIQLAQAMMRSDRGMMIKEIALEVGYNDQYYFSKIFKKITGIWPTEYLKD